MKNFKTKKHLRLQHDVGERDAQQHLWVDRRGVREPDPHLRVASEIGQWIGRNNEPEPENGATLPEGPTSGSTTGRRGRTPKLLLLHSRVQFQVFWGLNG